MTKPFGWGLIGCGDIARKRVAPAIAELEGCELVAVSRQRAQLAQAFAEEFNATRHYTAWRDLLNDPQITAVYIATPVDLHAEQTIAAAEAGKHVLCEKPMGLNVSECVSMMAAARAHNVKLGVAYYRRFYPAIARAKQIIARGMIGRPVLAQVNAFEYFDPAPNHPRAWLLNKIRSGGGPMFDFGCHRIEMLLNLFGPISKICALTANVVHDREVEDTASALFQFVNGGCAVLSVTHAAAEPQDTLEIFGSRGSIHIADLNRGVMRVVTSHGEVAETLAPDANLHAPMIRDFVDAVLSDREPAVSGEVGQTVAMIEEEIYRSE